MFSVCYPSCSHQTHAHIHTYLYPSCRHTTSASRSVHPSSHTVPHWPDKYSSTRPSLGLSPPTSLTGRPEAHAHTCTHRKTQFRLTMYSPDRHGLFLSVVNQKPVSIDLLQHTAHTFPNKAAPGSSEWGACVLMFPMKGSSCNTCQFSCEKPLVCKGGDA